MIGTENYGAFTSVYDNVMAHNDTVFFVNKSTQLLTNIFILINFIFLQFYFSYRKHKEMGNLASRQRGGVEVSSFHI